MRARAYAPLIALVAVLAACSSGSGDDDSTPTPSASTSTSASPTVRAAQPTPLDSPPASPSPSDSDTVARIGGPAVALPGDVKVQVGQPVQYPEKTTITGLARQGDTLTVYPITIWNTGAKPVDATLTAVNAYAGGEQVDGLYDNVHATNTITGTILPGQHKKGTYSFLTRKADQGTMQIEVFVPTSVQSHGIFTEPGAGTT